MTQKLVQRNNMPLAALEAQEGQLTEWKKFREGKDGKEPGFRFNCGTKFGYVTDAVAADLKKGEIEVSSLGYMEIKGDDKQWHSVIYKSSLVTLTIKRK